MNKEIISEINRFREISNLPLILEGKFPWSLFDEITTWVGKTADEDLFTFISKPTADVKATQLLDELNSVSRKLNLKGGTEELIGKLEKKTLSELEADELGAALLRAGNKELQDIAYKSYLKISPAVQIMKNTLNGTKTQDIINSGDKAAIEELRKGLKSPIEKSTELGDEVKRYYYDLIDEKLGKVDEEAVDAVSELTTLAKTKGILSDFFYEFYKKYFGGEISAFISEVRRWYDTFVGSTANIAKIKELSDELTDELTKSVEAGAPSINPKKYQRLVELIFSLKKEVYESEKRLLKKLYEEGTISKPVYEELIKNDSVFNEWVAKILEKGDTVGLGWTAAEDTWRAFRRMLDPTYPFRKAFDVAKKSKGTPKEVGYWGAVGQLYQEQMARLFWQVVWADPRLPSEVLTLRNVRGTTPLALVAGQVSSHLVVGNFIVPTALGTLEYVYNLLWSKAEALTGEQEVLFGEADKEALGMKEWDKSEYWWNLVTKYRTEGWIKPDKMTFDEKFRDIALFWTNIDEALRKWEYFNWEGLSPDEKNKKLQEMKKDLEEAKTEGQNYIAKVDSSMQTTIAPVKEEIKALTDSASAAIETGTEKVQDFIDDNQDVVDDAKEIISGGELSQSNASDMGVSDGAYRRWVTNNNATLTKISDNELELYIPRVDKYYEIKKVDGEWYFGGDKEHPMVESKIIKKRNMKTLNESIREKLTSKYIDKSKKFIKITENLEKVYPYFEEENYDVFFKKMFKLAESFKKSKLYINEADEELFSKGLSLLSGQEDMIKEKLVSYISSALSLTGRMKEFISQEIMSVPNTELGTLFTSPRKVAEMIADAVVDQARSSKPMAKDLMSAIEISTIPYFETSEFRRKLVRELQDLIGPKMDEKKGQISQIVKDLLKKAQED